MKFLVQLHWENPADLRTEFVAQTEAGTPGDVETWATEVIGRRKGECPEGWRPLICTEDSPKFVMAVNPIKGGG